MSEASVERCFDLAVGQDRPEFGRRGTAHQVEFEIQLQPNVFVACHYGLQAEIDSDVHTLNGDANGGSKLREKVIIRADRDRDIVADEQLRFLADFDHQAGALHDFDFSADILGKHGDAKSGNQHDLRNSVAVRHLSS